MKIVINDCWGGFGVSEDVYKELGITWDEYGYLDNEHFNIKSANFDAYRSHPKLIAAIEKVGIEKASGWLAKLKIVEIPDDVDWYIHDYDGMETIHEKHRYWE